jgi:hypothetical protein
MSTGMVVKDLILRDILIAIVVATMLFHYSFSRVPGIEGSQCQGESLGQALSNIPEVIEPQQHTRLTKLCWRLVDAFSF